MGETTWKSETAFFFLMLPMWFCLILAKRWPKWEGYQERMNQWTLSLAEPKEKKK